MLMISKTRGGVGVFYNLSYFLSYDPILTNEIVIRLLSKYNFNSTDISKEICGNHPEDGSWKKDMKKESR